MNAYMHKKEEREGKCFLKVAVGLGQALMPNLNYVDYQGTHLWWSLFYLWYYNPLSDRIMQDPNIKIIPVIWPILEYHLGVIIVYTLVQQ